MFFVEKKYMYIYNSTSHCIYKLDVINDIINKGDMYDYKRTKQVI